MIAGNLGENVMGHVLITLGVILLAIFGIFCCVIFFIRLYYSTKKYNALRKNTLKCSVCGSSKVNFSVEEGIAKLECPDCNKKIDLDKYLSDPFIRW